MWLITNIWADYTGNQHIGLECTECNKKVKILYAIDKIIKPCGCEKI